MGRAWRMVRDQFGEAGLGTPALDARLLAERAFGVDGLQLATGEHDAVPSGGMVALEALATRRMAGEPVARILGHKEFYGLDFSLNAATLVPRPETELLVELGLEALKSRKSARIADLGAGSGCIGISILVNSADSHLVAVDLSAEALIEAERNATSHGVEARCAFRQGSWFEPLAEGEKFDLIVSNPPYIETGDIVGLDIEVCEYDPVLALDGGPDGLAPYRIIAQQAGNYLKVDGTVVVEVGLGQAQRVVEMFVAAGFAKTSVHNDLGGIARCVLATC